MSTRRCAQTAASLFAAVVAFQLALTVGAPWGAYTQGGQDTGVLEPTGRLVAGSSAVIVAAMALTVLAAVGIGPLKTAKLHARIWAMRATTAYAGVAVLANIATRSSVERAVWAPVSIALLVCCVRVLQGTRRP